MAKRVVISGIGTVNAIGNNVNDFWSNLTQGVSGITKHQELEEFPSQIAGGVKNFDYLDYCDKKEARRMDRVQILAIAATTEAIKDSGLVLDAIDKNRVGVIVGSGIGGIISNYEQVLNLHQRGLRGVSPFYIPRMISDMISGLISIRYGFKGPNYCVVSACATGSHNIGSAYNTIINDEADIVISGGAEASIHRIGFAGFCAMRAMSTRNDSPETASRPFDKNRDGFVMGEGAGILILESLDHALKRNATIYGEVLGYGFSGDAYHLTAPDPTGEGVILAIQRAINHAKITPNDIEYINMHGTATPMGDISETNAIKKFFKNYAYKLSLNSTKSMIGHTLGAAGAIESIAILLSLKDGIIHPTTGFETADPECDLDYTFHRAKKKPIRIGMNHAFGFGGHNTALIFGKFEN